MGYFRRKLRRGVCLAEKRDPVARFAPAPLTPCPSSVPRPRRYVRLAADYRDPDSKHHAGVFQAASDLIHGGDLTRDEIRSLRGGIHWFRENLHSPDWLRVPQAIFWFKSDADECIRNVWYLVSLLRAHGRHMRIIVTREPGSIVYQDEHQVAAVPRRRC